MAAALFILAIGIGNGDFEEWDWEKVHPASIMGFLKGVAGDYQKYQAGTETPPTVH